jgi:hypothetical protein
MRHPRGGAQSHDNPRGRRQIIEEIMVPGPVRRRLAPLVCFALTAVVVSACDQVLDAGRNETQGLLPVGPHNPVILINDSATDNWSPEYLALSASNGGPRVAGIVVTASPYWPDLDANLAGWQTFVADAGSSGLRGLPDPVGSASPQLVVPPDRLVESTRRNHSAGAQLILRKSSELSLPGQPLVVLSCAQLTDVADAYLIDPTVVDRVVVVAQVGTYSSSKASMASPNGDLDPWADWIVAQHFAYVQISVYYDQNADVTAYDVDALFKNLFGTRMAAKRASFPTLPNASDQEAILVFSEATFVTSVVRSVVDILAGFNSPPGQGPPLVAADGGNAWLVTGVDAAAARARLWQMLTNPNTFRP